MYLPTHPAFPFRIGRAALNAGIHGISARKVYPLLALLTGAVGSYPTFSPSPYQWHGSNFLWHYLVPVNREPAVNRCVALCCPDFPMVQNTIDSTACSG